MDNGPRLLAARWHREYIEVSLLLRLNEQTLDRRPCHEAQICRHQTAVNDASDTLAAVGKLGPPQGGAPRRTRK